MQKMLTPYLPFVRRFHQEWLFLLIVVGASYTNVNAGILPGETDRLITPTNISKPAVFARQSIVSFTLINADTEQPIQTLSSGALLNLATLPTKNLNIRANTSPSLVGSVLFALSGQQVINRIELEAPYELLGNAKNNDTIWSPVVGSYTLKATPYSKADSTGIPGTALTVTFEVVSNQLPTANAGPDKVITLPTTSTVLTGSGSDADGTIKGYSWSQVSGPTAATFSSKTIASPSVNKLAEGIYFFSLRVKDNQNMWSAINKVKVTVRKPGGNSPPEIVQMPLNQLFNTEKTFTFSAGNYADPNAGDLLTYTATLADGSLLPAWLRFNASTLTFSGLTPAEEIILNVRVKITDKAQASVSVSFKITVQRPEPAVISGELKKWHKVTLTFTGPVTSETDATNPFLNYRLNVVFRKGNRQLIVPGYYAADGNAAESSAAAGTKWRVHFSPDEIGEWSYKASFRIGPEVAVSNLADAGNASAFDGLSGSFIISSSDKKGADLRAQGRLRYTGQHHLQFAETEKYFLKGGAGSPENFLAYRDFDGTYSHGTTDYTKTYTAHRSDWKTGNPVWRSVKGKGIIGAINYLASKGMNSVYFLTLNVNGDGKDVWPWTSHTERFRYDVSKLDQWEIVFSHMDKMGFLLHVITQEQENDQLLDGGVLGIQRKLYYRELLARFGHHLAITWNLGEESTNTDAQRKAFGSYIRQLDPYNSPIVVHTHPEKRAAIYSPLLGYSNLEGPSLQIINPLEVHQETLNWLQQSAANGKKWVVNLDEIGPSWKGVLPDSEDYNHEILRKKALWGNLMAGGGGVEWYFGYKFPHSDVTAEDWRSRDHMWNLTRYALSFFNQHLPYWQMKNANNLTATPDDYCLADPGKVYAIYLPQGGSTTLDVGTTTATYQVKWFNPRTGGSLQSGTIQQIAGSGEKSLGLPPQNEKQDWVCLVTKAANTSIKPAAMEPSYLNPESVAGAEAVISVYPNPIRNQITIDAQLPKALPLEITLLDGNGKQLITTASAEAKRHTKRLSTAHLKSGIYLLQVKYGNQSTTRKLVK